MSNVEDINLVSGDCVRHMEIDDNEEQAKNEASICIICNKPDKWVYKNRKRVRDPLSIRKNTSKDLLIESAAARNDDVFCRIEASKNDNTVIKYHYSCRNIYIKNTSKKQEAISRQNAHDSAYSKLKSFIEKSTITKSHLTLTLLKEKYLKAYNKLRPTTPLKNIKTKKLKEKLRQDFPTLVLLQPVKQRSAVLLQPKNLVLDSTLDALDTSLTSVSTATHMSEDAEVPDSDVTMCRDTEIETRLQSENQRILHTASCVLKSSFEKSTMPKRWPPYTEDISLTAAEDLVPAPLFNFVASLCGEEQDLINTNEFVPTSHDSQILSICQDIISLKNKTPTPKSLALGMMVHSLTRSSKLIDTLHGLGHSVSTSTTLRLQTAYAALENENDIPSTMHKNVFTTLVWDNIDFNEETNSGKGTTHYTNGIIIQPSADQSDETVYIRTSQRIISKKSTRKPELQSPVVLPYNAKQSRRGPSINQVSLCSEDSLTNAADEDLRYVILKFYNVENGLLLKAPHWTNYFSLLQKNSNCKSVIGYLRPIQSPATEMATVNTLLQRSSKIADELNLPQVVVVLDLALYAKAQSILWTDSALSQKIVLRLGEFHTCMSYMQVIWKRFSGSGLEQVIIESEIVAEGSLKGVISGHQYNRCIRTLKILYESFQRLCYESFTESEYFVEVQNKLPVFKDAHSIIGADVNEKLIEAYKKFILVKSESNECFKFWFSFIDMVQILLSFIKATRSNNWELHLACIQKMAPWMFAYDHINYSRYLSAYLCEMLNYKGTLVWDQLTKNFTVVLSSGTFNAIACDQAIENTANKDTKVSGGWVGMTKKKHAVNRWVSSQNQRQKITENCIEMAHRKQHHSKSNDDSMYEDGISNVTSVIKNFFNPFDGKMSAITNIMTGVAASEEITNDLTKAYDVGKIEFENFIGERIKSNAKGLHDSIKKNNLKTFSSNSKKQKITTSEKEIMLKADKKVFSRLLILSQKKEVDLDEVLKFSLNVLPLSLCDIDGTMLKTSKSVTLHQLEIFQDNFVTNNGAIIVDGMGILHSFNPYPEMNFGNMANDILQLLKRMCETYGCSRCDFVTDHYPEKSIKSAEHDRRVLEGSKVYKKIEQSKKIKEWSNFISVPENKNLFVDFMYEHWSSNISTLGNLSLFYSHGNQCHLFHDEDGKCIVKEISDLASDHEEGDTKVILHAEHAAKSCSELLICTPDTDVVLLTMALLKFEKTSVTIRIGMGKSLRLLNIAEMQNKWSHMLDALIGFHTITGSDCTSCFRGKGKVKPLKILMTSPKFIQILSRLGEEFDISDDIISQLEEFVAAIYVCKSENLNKARAEIFKSQGHSDDFLPPTHDAFVLHAKRSNYYSAILKRAKQKKIEPPSPALYGWNDDYRPIWCIELPAPELLLNNIHCNCQKNCSNKRCSCKKNEMLCSSSCGCKEECCENRPAKKEFEDVDGDLLSMDDCDDDFNTEDD